MSRPRHPDQHIERAVAYAEQVGWRVIMSHGHAWGRLLCPFSDRSGCQISVYSTPRSAENHARAIVRNVEMCPHGEAENDDDDE